MIVPPSRRSAQAALVLCVLVLLGACQQKQTAAFAPTGADDDSSDASLGENADGGSNNAGTAGTGAGGGGGTGEDTGPFTFDTLGNPAKPPIIASGDSISCAIKKDRSMLCWNTPPGVDFPFPDKNGYSTLACGTITCAALHANGKAYVVGQILVANGASETYAFDDAVPGKKLVRVSAAAWAVCGVTSEGEAHCWDIHDDPGTGKTASDLSMDNPPPERFTQVQPLVTISSRPRINGFIGIDKNSGVLRRYALPQDSTHWVLESSTLPKDGKFKQLIGDSGGITEDGVPMKWDRSTSELTRVTTTGPIVIGRFYGDGICGILEDGKFDCMGNPADAQMYRFVTMAGNYAISSSGRIFQVIPGGGIAQIPPGLDKYP